MSKSPKQKARRRLAFSQCSDDRQRYARCLRSTGQREKETPPWNEKYVQPKMLLFWDQVVFLFENRHQGCVHLYYTSYSYLLMIVWVAGNSALTFYHVLFNWFVMSLTHRSFTKKTWNIVNVIVLNGTPMESWYKWSLILRFRMILDHIWGKSMYREEVCWTMSHSNLINNVMS